uniref:Putative secreted protein n=1 Tax=Ixodes ricinus TaxID=34613 RepID=A0A6B0UFS9_IXORI
MRLSHWSISLCVSSKCRAAMSLMSRSVRVSPTCCTHRSISEVCLFCSRPRVSSRSRTMSPTATAYVCSRFSMVSKAGEWMSVWYMCGNRDSGVSSSALA